MNYKALVGTGIAAAALSSCTPFDESALNTQRAKPVSSQAVQPGTLDHLMYTGNKDSEAFRVPKKEFMLGIKPYVTDYLNNTIKHSYAKTLDLATIYGVFSTEFPPVITDKTGHNKGEHGVFPLDDGMRNIWDLPSSVTGNTYNTLLQENPRFNTEQALHYLHKVYNHPPAQRLFDIMPNEKDGPLLMAIVRGDIKAKRGTADKNFQRLLHGSARDVEMGNLSSLEKANRLKNYEQGRQLAHEYGTGSLYIVKN